MNIQTKFVGAFLLFILMLIHIFITVPPNWTYLIAGLVGAGYYSIKVWFIIRCPLQLVLFALEAMIVVASIYYGLWLFRILIQLMM